MSGHIARGRTTPTPSHEENLACWCRSHSFLAKIPGNKHLLGLSLVSQSKITQKLGFKLSPGGPEVAHHGWTHVPPDLLNLEQEEYEMILANEAIKKILRQKSTGGTDLQPGI
ncbi:MAG: hypothetical protein CM1200mP6_02550 [Anaerolineaceae bacterium]|nr:MAG: hypothetical protein CM1200mP6_02550 [Anaerolineaceae bacterium]